MKRLLSAVFMMSFSLTSLWAVPSLRNEVLATAEKVNDYFMSRNQDPTKPTNVGKIRPSHLWTRAVYYEGLTALYEVAPKPSYLEYIDKWGDFHEWTPRNGVNTVDADDQCCGQTYLWRYGMTKDDRMLNPLKQNLNLQIKTGKKDYWWWIDAIQMAMPVYAQMTAVTGNPEYLDYAVESYLYSRDSIGGGLYNIRDGLWWRDKRFIEPYVESDGKPCYWSRGNGWVYAALVRTLEAGGIDNPKLSVLKDDFINMSKSLLRIQRPDGFWNPSLASEAYAGAELSGTALFLYGMSWGIINGILSGKAYEKSCELAWKAIKSCVHPNGFLGFVQGTGSGPADSQPVTFDKVPDFEDYGTGCFLLGATEYYRLLSQHPLYSSIRPGKRWLDTEGKPIQAHGFQIFENDGTYYWYGENKEFTELGSNVWTYGIRAYRSNDFYNWEDLGLIIEPDTENPLSPLHFSQTLDRPHILYNKNTGKYVCWIKSMDTDGFFVVLQADEFTGPYEIVRTFKPEGYGVGDFDMYVDPETGKGYVWFERPHWEMICAELTDDFTATNGKYSVHFSGLRPPFTREAPAHFVRDGKHYMFTSGTTGYVPNPTQTAVLSDYPGEYTELGSPHINDKFSDSFASQITSVIKIPGKDLYIALADRWLPEYVGTDVPARIFKDKEKSYLDHKPYDKDFTVPAVKDKTGYKRGKWDTTVDARYVFLPISFTSDGTPIIKWRDEWRIEDVHMPADSDVGPENMPENIANIQAPFSMIDPKKEIETARELWSKRTYTVEMNKKGMSTDRIQKAIDKVSRLGGGTVVIPEGKWISGRISLKDNVNLKISDDAVLEFSGMVRDYLPVVFTRDEGIEVYSLGAFIYAEGVKNIAITGKGRIVGPSTDCEIYRINHEKALNIEVITKDTPLEKRIFDGKQNGGEVFLPKTISPINCRNVLIEGVTLDQGLYWNVVPQYCDNVVIRGVTVNSYGHGRTDGIDVDSSSDVLIEYCSLDCQDDCYTMKSGRGEDGLRVNRPTSNVIVRNSIALRGAGGIVCGTEIAGGVQNVYMHDCIFKGTDQAFRFKTLRTRGGGIDGIFVERVRASVTGPAFYCDMLGSIKWGGDLARRYPLRPVDQFTPRFRNISISDVDIIDCGIFMSVRGLPEQPLENVNLSDFRVSAQKYMFINDVEGLNLNDIDIRVHNEDMILDGCSDIKFNNLSIN